MADSARRQEDPEECFNRGYCVQSPEYEDLLRRRRYFCRRKWFVGGGETFRGVINWVSMFILSPRPFFGVTEINNFHGLSREVIWSYTAVPSVKGRC